MADSRLEIKKTYHSDGTLRSEYETINGVSHGYYRQYHKNGQLQVETYYENGRQKEGKVISYHSNGQLARRVFVDNFNMFNGDFEEFFSNGGIKARGFYTFNKRFDREVYYSNGVLKKEWVFDENSHLSPVHKTLDNKLEEMIYLAENGITVKAKGGRNGAKAGEYYELNGEKYYVAGDNEIHGIVRNTRDIGVPLSRVVTSKVTSMYRLFNSLTNFNEDIRSWDTSRVRNMNEAFYMCKSFNQPIEVWDLSKVRKTSNMFYGCTNFNQPIGFWDTGSLEVMNSMFEGTESFNQPIENWDISCVTNMQSAFKRAKSFNQSLSNWNIGHKGAVSWRRPHPWMLSLFEEATSFNGSLGGWKLGGPISSMFKGAEKFNQPLDSWDVSGVTSMKSLFEGALSFNQDLTGWDTGKVTSFDSMFYRASSFNGAVSAWDLENSINMTNMFRGAKSFNQDISRWNVTNVTKMNNLFRDAESFNQDISIWSVNKAIKPSKTIFQNANSFVEGEYSPFDQKEKTKRVAQTDGAATALGISLNKKDKVVISKIKRLLKVRDLDKIDIGVELLQSLSDVGTYEILLHGCAISKEKDSYGILHPILVRNKFFIGSGPAQPFLDYALLNLIVDVPPFAKVDKSISKSGLIHLDIGIFNLDFDYAINFDRFVSLGKLTHLQSLKINLRGFGKTTRGSVVDLSQVFKGSRVEKLEISNFQGSYDCLRVLKELRSLTLTTDFFSHHVGFDDTFPHLDNLIELEFYSDKSNLNFISKLPNLERLKIHIPEMAFINKASAVTPRALGRGLSTILGSTNEKELSADWNDSLGEIGNLRNLKNLIIESKGIERLGSSLRFIGRINSLKFLDINCYQVNIVDFLSDCISLEEIKLTLGQGLQGYVVLVEAGSLEGLSGLMKLRKFNLGTLEFNFKNAMNTLIHAVEVEVEVDVKGGENGEMSNDSGYEFSERNIETLAFSKTSTSNREFSTAKKLLSSMDADSIDEGIQKLVDLNIDEYFEILLNGVELQGEKLVRNKFFEGKYGAPQSYLDYALLKIIACAPDRVNINKSIQSSQIKELTFSDYGFQIKRLSNEITIPIKSFGKLQKLVVDSNYFSSSKAFEYLNIDEDNEISIEVLDVVVQRDMSFLGFFHQIRKLNLKFTSPDYNVSNLNVISQLTNLEELTIFNDFHVRLSSLDFIRGCTALKSLTIENRGNSVYNNFEALTHLPKLVEFAILGSSSVKDFNHLALCVNLQKLTIHNCYEKLDISVFNDLVNLEELHIYGSGSYKIKTKVIKLLEWHGVKSIKKMTIDSVELSNSLGLFGSIDD
jgi:surface protein